jgi:hypothetical protein
VALPSLRTDLVVVTGSHVHTQSRAPPAGQPHGSGLAAGPLALSNGYCVASSYEFFYSTQTEPNSGKMKRDIYALCFGASSLAQVDTSLSQKYWIGYSVSIFKGLAISTTVPKRLCCLALTVEVELIIPTNDGDAARRSSIGNAVASASSKEQLITR